MFTIGSCPLQLHQVGDQVLLHLLKHSCHSCSHILAASTTAGPGRSASSAHHTPVAKHPTLKQGWQSHAFVTFDLTHMHSHNRWVHGVVTTMVYVVSCNLV